MPPTRRLPVVDCCLAFFCPPPRPQRGGRKSKAARRRRPAKKIRDGRFGRLRLQRRHLALAPNGHRIREATGACGSVRLGRWGSRRARRPPAAKSREFRPPRRNGIARAIAGPARPHNPQNGQRGGPGNAPWAGDGAQTTCDDGGDAARTTAVMSPWCGGCEKNCAPVIFKGATLTQNSETMAACTRGNHMRPSSPNLEFPGVVTSGD